MDFDKFLSENRSNNIKKWRDVIISTYPGDTQRFLRKEKNQFSNPVGHIITKEIEILYDALIQGGEADSVSSSLDKIIRVRAVQDFKPSHAIGFVLELKNVVREGLKDKEPLNGQTDDLRNFEDRIDQLALLAFDIYSQCRQKIYEIRVNEVKNQVGSLLKRANLAKENTKGNLELQEE